MEHYTVEKDIEFTPGLTGQSILDEITNKIMRSLTPDMVACMLAGVAVDTIVEAGKITIKTRNPVSILKDSTGRIINIYEKKK